MPCRESAGADNLFSRQGLGRKSAKDGRSQLCQTQGWILQRIPARPFFDKLAALQCAHFEAGQVVDEFRNLIGLDLYFFSHYERGVKPEGCDEVAGLELPSGEWTIDDFEAQCQPVCSGERSCGIEAFGGNRASQSKNNLRLNLQRTGMRNSKRR